MGIEQILSGSHIYLDTNIFIYALEGYPEYLKILTDLFRMIDDARFQAYTSELTLAETLVKPMMDSNIPLQKAYQEAVQTAGFLKVLPVSREILISAARIRSQNAYLKLPDAIHLSTAQHKDCQIFLTNDRRLKNFSGINTIILSEC